MNSLVSLAVRRSLHKSIGQQVRPLSSTSVPIDVDHYTSGWNIGDISDFTTAGKYQIQTFNKISPKVCGRERKIIYFNNMLESSWDIITGEFETNI